MSLRAITCDACGGSVAMPAGAEVPECLFCGSESLRLADFEEQVEPPSHWLPFSLDEDGARAAFRGFTRSSIWYPSDLRQARLKLRRLLLPAWVWSGTVETHWAALVRASTRSGKRPASGEDRLRCEGLLVPASSAISRRELQGIAPFPLEGGEPLRGFDDLQARGVPFELGLLTRSIARQRAERGLAELHHARLDTRLGALRLRTSALFHELDGRPWLLPVWIGTYRRGERWYRVVINGQSGALVGEAPISWFKVLGALAGAATLIVVALALSGATG